MNNYIEVEVGYRLIQDSDMKIDVVRTIDNGWARETAVAEVMKELQANEIEPEYVDICFVKELD